MSSVGRLHRCRVALEVGRKAGLSVVAQLREKAGLAAAACAAELVKRQGKKGPVNEKKKASRNTSQDLMKAGSQKKALLGAPCSQGRAPGATKQLKLCLPKRNKGFSSMAYILY